jgi:hypothetical protein
MIEYNSVFKNRPSYLYSEEVVPSQFVKERLENHLHESIEGADCIIYEVNPRVFINPDRLDIIIKLGFLEKKISAQSNYDAKIIERYYLEHIKCFNFGEYFEYGSNKESADDFVNAFMALFESIKINGFSSEKSIIPVNKFGIPINGAHRIACSIFLDIPVRIILLDCKSESYNATYFSSRGLEGQAIRYALNYLIDLNPIYRVGVIWPRGDVLSRSEYISKYIIKSQAISFNQVLFLVLLLYSHDDWVRLSVTEGGDGIFNKALSCFSRSPAHFFIKEYADDTDAIEEKESLRSIAQLDKHSIHICDTPAQSKDIVNLIFSDDALITYNELRIDRFISFYRVVSEMVLKNKLDWNHFLVSGSSLIFLVGGRLNRDVDYFVLNPSQGFDKNIATHNSHFLDLGIDIEALHHDSCHLKIFNCLFFSLPALQYIKSIRNEPKDQYDLEVIKGLIHRNASRVKKYKSALRYYGNYFRANARLLIVIGLEKMHLKHFFKNLLRKK